ncbi:TRAP transporter solute receptor, TAXI family [Ferroglobus placidus DSM 10642]|uniref:TRAP transporter solute receptor, TAXI family n=1 Tax=Ferroglobus placidus (strain DSM 10642 / AEDII12DO) TaxID=589924 RepID=D3S2P7_FERPA|nr:TAXI family TRAP transporter solute-binding subunit [Ferroglobus placidus]ADC64577.1 TRAP transporter solute receptor, TAXI family [Ferroglobus placidus DSM 10642]
MRQTVLLLLIALLIVTTFLGCAQPTEKKTPTPAQTPTLEKKEAVKLRLLTYSVGSSWYIMGSSIAQVIQDYLPPGSSVDVVPGPGAIGNLGLLAKNEGDLAITFDTYAYFAYNGMPPYEEKIPNIRMVVNKLSPYFLLFAVKKEFAEKNNIKTLDDVIKMIKDGKSVVIVTGKKGSLDEYATRVALELYGVTYDDIKKAGGDVLLGTSEDYRVEVLKTGKAQVFADVGTYNHPLWLKLTAATDVVYLPLNDEVIEKFKDYGLTPYTVEKGTFEGMNEDIKTVGLWACIVARSDIPDEIIFIVTKAIVENKERLIEAFAGFERFDVKHAGESLIPLHDGAKKYFESK